MNIYIKIFLLVILLLFPFKAFAAEYRYILNDDCINVLYSNAKIYFNISEIFIIRESRGIVIRYWFEDFSSINYSIIKNIEYFLAKLENPAIIEVHTGNFSDTGDSNLKKWEVSTILANKIEDIITEPSGVIKRERINSVGYGEFLPAKNTSNNGGNYLNRIDIIVLCNISGE